MPLAFQCFSSASQDRLEKLIAARLAPEADKKAIDRRIWDLFGETLAPYNAGKLANERIDLGMGIGFGQMLRIGDADVFGAEVNAAAKLGEDTAKAGEIFVTQAVADVCSQAGEFACERIDYVPPGAVAAFRLRY